MSIKDVTSFNRYIFGFTLQQLILLGVSLVVFASFYNNYRNTKKQVQNLEAKVKVLSNKLEGTAAN